jgi:hypothetical protein
VTSLAQLATQYAFHSAPGVTGSAAAAGLVCRDSVLANFAAMALMLGAPNFLYCDSNGVARIAFNLYVDTEPMAAQLAWQNLDGSPASPMDVQTAWSAIKQAYPGTQGPTEASKEATSVRLQWPAFETLARNALKVNDAYFAAHIPGYASLPADAQMGMHLMAVGAGTPSVVVSKLAASLSKRDFATASKACALGDPTQATRNAADALLLGNAGKVVTQKVDPARLYYLDAVAGAPAPAGSKLGAGTGQPGKPGKPGAPGAPGAPSSGSQAGAILDGGTAKPAPPTGRTGVDPTALLLDAAAAVGAVALLYLLLRKTSP